MIEEILKINDEDKITAYLRQIMRHHPAILSSFGKTLHLDILSALYDFHADWPEVLKSKKVSKADLVKLRTE